MTETNTPKAAIVILSDPKGGGEEALGRLFNGLAAAWDVAHRGGEVTILFQGAGTRWAGELTRPDHPAHDLYRELQDRVAGVSCGCAAVFGATEEAEKSGFDLLKDNPVPGTSGLPSLARLMAEGYHVLTF
jgi:hypothetical protein